MGKRLRKKRISRENRIETSIQAHKAEIWCCKREIRKAWDTLLKAAANIREAKRRIAVLELLRDGIEERAE